MPQFDGVHLLSAMNGILQCYRGCLYSCHASQCCSRSELCHPYSLCIFKFWYSL